MANPRHAALAQALARAKALQPPVDARLDPLVSAMTAKAWTGGTSDAFIADLNGNKRALHTSSEGCIDNLQLTYQLQQELKKDPNAGAYLIQGLNVPGAVGSTNALAGAMSFVINSGYQGDKNNEDFKKAQAAALSKAMGIVLAAPTFAVPESAPWTGYLLDQVEGAALDKVGEGRTATQRAPTTPPQRPPSATCK